VGDEDTHTTIGKCIYSDLETNNCENCRYSPCNARIIARRKQYKRHGGFCSQECFDNAHHDGMVKNDSFDNFDYKSLRKKVKAGTLDHSTFVAMIQQHLDEWVIDKNFPHTSSQKEEHVDKQYLAQWFKDNKRLRDKKS